MVRHYERIGLLPKAGRTASNYRMYGADDVHMLRFIKRARGLGFSTADIKELLGLWRNKSRSSSAVKRSMVHTLEHLVAHCRGDHRPECPILEDLGRS